MCIVDIIPSFGLLDLAVGLILRLGRQIGHALECALRIPVHRVPVDTISRSLRVARRGVLHLGRRSSYREETLAASQWRSQSICCFATLLAKRVVGEAANGIT